MKKIATEIQRVLVEVFTGHSFFPGDRGGMGHARINHGDVERISNQPQLVVD